MKHKGCTAYLVEDRNEELLRAYIKIVKRGVTPLSEVYKELKTVPCRRFWVTGVIAYNNLVIRRKRDKNTGFSERRAMYDEIERRAMQYMHEHNTTFRKACREVVTTPAPRFYLDERTMGNIVRMMLKRRRKENSKV